MPIKGFHFRYASCSGWHLCFISLRTAPVFGRYVYAVGGNAEAAYLSGVNVRSITLRVFATMGALMAVAGIVMTARVGSASPEAGRLLELDAIAACVIGGASLMGGRGSIFGAIFGAFVMESLNKRHEHGKHGCLVAGYNQRDCACCSSRVRHGIPAAIEGSLYKYHSPNSAIQKKFKPFSQNFPLYNRNLIGDLSMQYDSSTYTDLTDEELIRLVQSGDEEAFAQLAARYSSRIWQLVVWNSRQVRDAEEIFQDIWVAVWKTSVVSERSAVSVHGFGR